MPELPEVETARAGLAPHLKGRRVREVVLRRPDLERDAGPGGTGLLDELGEVREPGLRPLGCERGVRRLGPQQRLLMIAAAALGWIVVSAVSRAIN